MNVLASSNQLAIQTHCAGAYLAFLVQGLPGSGKSTLAAELARELRCPLIDKDDARDVFQPVVPQAPDLDWNGTA